jgi:magnesium transporter
MITCFLSSLGKLNEVDIVLEDILPRIKKKGNYAWMSLENPTDDELKFIKEKFEVHPTTTEDLLSGQTRAKYEEFEEYTFIVMKSILELKENSVETNNIYLIIGKNYLITNSTNKNHTIEELKAHPKKIESLIKKGPDYLAHYIMDKEVDRYLEVKTDCSEELKNIEREFMEDQDKEILRKLFSKEVLFIELRHLAEAMTSNCMKLIKISDNYISDDLSPNFRDVYDHLVRTADGYKTMLTRIESLNNMYISMNSMKTNETMKALTVIMALLLPLTVITGFYGMNITLPFQNSPNAYIGIIIAMFMSSIIMMYILIKQGWVSKKRN